MVSKWSICCWAGATSCGPSSKQIPWTSWQYTRKKWPWWCHSCQMNEGCLNAMFQEMGLDKRLGLFASMVTLWMLTGDSSRLQVVYHCAPKHSPCSNYLEDCGRTRGRPLTSLCSAGFGCKSPAAPVGTFSGILWFHLVKNALRYLISK